MNKLPKHISFYQILLCTLLCILLFSCEKFDQISTNPNLKLNFSQDSIVFDTVFASVGSISKRLMIYNESEENLEIAQIRLASGIESAYRFNVDGSTGVELENIEIRANDSAFVFIRVLIDPNDQNSPFVVEDQIEFLTNGNLQTVNLVSWGQNAHYILANETEEGVSFKSIAQNGETIVWDQSKPYLVYGYARVDSNAVLRITEGTQIFFHNESGLWIDKDAQLLVEGSLEHKVRFQGDRLDEDYEDITNQWDKIWIEGGDADHSINHAIIKNARIGLHLDNKNQSVSTIQIINSIIENMNDHSILSLNFSIIGYNNVCINAGQSLLHKSGSGNLDLNHCTFRNNWQHSFRSQASIYIDAAQSNSSNIHIGNSIIDGNLSNELLLLNIPANNFTYLFDHCAIKTDLDLNNESFIDPLISSSTIFDEADLNSYFLIENASVIDLGKSSLAELFPMDLLNQSRNEGADLGALEYTIPQPK